MLIDAFTYFNEKELVELRLKYLNSIVDYFVVIESNITFTGKEKKWNFPKVLKNNLKEFSHKIQYHQLDIKLDKILVIFDDLDLGIPLCLIACLMI